MLFDFTKSRIFKWRVIHSCDLYSKTKNDKSDDDMDLPNSRGLTLSSPLIPFSKVSKVTEWSKLYEMAERSTTHQNAHGGLKANLL